MPLLKSAIKKLKTDRRRTRENSGYRQAFKKAVKAARAKPTKAALTKAFAALDLAAKKKVIHKNKASRLKSRLSLLLGRKG
ncbi:30S ribosomal protein S20 [Patescibacteria group bacterium]|nr:30S ribosomal protein S20 [Patescibacteria group bacterium]